jgi:hypothetical protein
VKVPSWPSGHLNLDGDVFEFGAGELTRVPVKDLKSIEVKEKAGRLSVKFAYTAGLNNVKTSAWVEAEHRGEVDELVAAIQGAMGG